MTKLTYAAAYLDEESNQKIKSFGFVKESFHVTTCFDTTHSILEMPHYSFQPQTAVIKSVVEWTVGGDIYLVAELSQCEWTSKLNILTKAYGAIEDLPHNPHISLIKGVEKGTAEKYQKMIGIQLNFNRHVIKSKDYQ